MANVISSLLVGIGFDYDKKSAQQIESGMDSIKSKALQLGSVVAGAFGIKALTSDFASSADMLGKFGEVFGVTANDMQAFGNALSTEGGSLESFMSQLESIERVRARIRVGDVSFFAPAGKAGLDPNAIADARNATEAYLGLADAFAGMTQQQRINAAEALGLDEASIRLLSQGRSAVDDLVAKFRDIRPLTGEMTDEAAEFNRQWIEAKANVGSFADAISTELLPVINDITQSVNSWFSEDRMGKIRAVGELTKATLGIGQPSEVAEATGLPEWLFTPVGDQITNFGEDIGLPDWMTQPLSVTASDVYQSVTQPFIGGTGTNTVVPPGQFRGGQAPTTQTINVNFEMDGEIIDRKVIRVVDGMAQTAIDDISSNTGG